MSPPEDDTTPQTPEEELYERDEDGDLDYTQPKKAPEPKAAEGEDEDEEDEPAPERDPFDDRDEPDDLDEAAEKKAPAEKAEGDEPKDDSEAGEPKGETPKEKGEGKDAEPQETVEIDGEKVPKSALADAWKARQTSEISAREAKRLKDSAQYAYEELARNPFKILLDIHTRRLGSREQAEALVAQTAEEFVLPFLQEKLMSEEQRESARLKRRVAYYEETEQQRRARAEEEQREKAATKYREWISGEIRTAIKDAELPDKPHVVKQMAAILHGQLERGEDADAKRAAAELKADFQALRASVLERLTPEEIRAVRQDLLDEARKADIETAREKRRQPTTRSAAASRDGSTAKRNGRGRRPVYRTMEEFREAVGANIYEDFEG